MGKSADRADARRNHLTVLPGGAGARPQGEDCGSDALARAWFTLWNVPSSEPVIPDTDDHIISGGSGVDDAPLPA
jgi:hypothetical protein